MKKIFSLFLCALLVAGAFAGCTTSENNAGSGNSPAPAANSPEPTPSVPADNVAASDGGIDDSNEGTGVVITIDVPNDTPVADADGKIPGSDAVSNVVRDTVVFGKAYQDAGGTELSPIEWIVLDEKDGYSLLLTKQIIDSRGWVDERRDATWAEADLRQWLNTDFWGTAFTAEEQAAVATFDVTQPQNPRYNTPAGEATLDKVTLLSYQELIKYMPTALERKTKPTAYAISQGCYENAEGDAAWWLRSPGESALAPEYLASAGDLGARTHYNNERIIGVRPTMWVRTSVLTAVS